MTWSGYVLPSIEIVRLHIAVLAFVFVAECCDTFFIVLAKELPNYFFSYVPADVLLVVTTSSLFNFLLPPEKTQGVIRNNSCLLDRSIDNYGVDNVLGGFNYQRDPVVDVVVVANEPTKERVSRLRTCNIQKQCLLYGVHLFRVRQNICVVTCWLLILQGVFFI